MLPGKTRRELPLAGTRIALDAPTQARAPGTPPPASGSPPRTLSPKTRPCTRSRPTRSGKARPAIATNLPVDVAVGLVGVVGAGVEGTPEGEAREMGPSPQGPATTAGRRGIGVMSVRKSALAAPLSPLTPPYAP